MSRKIFGVSLSILLLIVGTCFSSASDGDKKTIIEQTNRKYYNLRTQGFVEFECNVTPDWETSAQSFTADPAAREEVVAMLKKTNFDVAVGPTGAILVSHEFGQAPQSEEAATGLRQMAQGVDEMISGFFTTWVPFMVNPPFSGEAEEYQLEVRDDRYRFTLDSQKDHAVISMSRDLVIDSTEARTPAFDGTVRPRSQLHEGRLVLDGYDAEISIDRGPRQRLSVKIQYQKVNELLIPQRLSPSIASPQGQTTWL